jgi:hypothetical protein
MESPTPTGQWRIGRKVRQNVYDDRDNPVCQCHTEFHAALIVNAVNALVASRGKGRPDENQPTENLE